MKIYLSPKKFLVGLMAVSAAVISSQASASGYALREVSPSLMGNAYAGISTSNEDISSIAFNPATLAMIDENMFYASGTGIFPGISSHSVNGSVSFENPLYPEIPEEIITLPAGGNTSTSSVGKDAFIPAAFVALNLTDNIKAGLAITSPYGLATKYDDSWAGRYFAVDSRVVTFNIAPMASFSFNDHLSVAAGFQAQYLDARLSSATPIPNFTGTGFELLDIRNDLRGYGWGYGYTLGGLYEFTKHTRFGIGFQSKIDTTIKGNASASGDGEATFLLPAFEEEYLGAILASSGTAETHLTTPENINFGLTHDFNRHWTVMAEAQWTRWSRFEDLNVKINSTEGETTSIVEENWKNSWFYAVGATYRPDKQWTFRGGAQWDETPVQSDFRNPTLPDSDRFGLAAGVGYNITPCLRVDLGYMHLFFRGASVDLTDVEVAPGETKSMSADYNGHADLVSLGLSWEF